MKKMVLLITFTASFIINSICLGATLTSMSKSQFEKVFFNKTFTSIATDNLNGRTIDNTFSMFLDDQGNIWGKMSYKPANEPQKDKGTYSVDKNGVFYITWQHWDNAKKLCFHVFEPQNAFMSVDCNNIFHTVFMKATTQLGNHL